MLVGCAGGSVLHAETYNGDDLLLNGLIEGDQAQVEDEVELSQRMVLAGAWVRFRVVVGVRRRRAGGRRGSVGRASWLMGLN